MSTFTAPVEIGDSEGRTWAQIDAIVDTGSTYTWVPRDILDSLGVRARFRREFETADQRVVTRDLAITMSRLNGQEMPTIVVFADEGGVPLLGAYTLGGFGLAADPVNGRLIPVRALAMTSFYGAARTTEATLEVRHLLEGLVPGHGDMLEGLHRIQHHYGYIPKASIPAVAQHLRIPEARVYGAVTYYSEFRETPPPDTTISWCSGPACFVKGSENLKLVLENMLGCTFGEKHRRQQDRPAPGPVQRHLRQRPPGLGRRQGRRSAYRGQDG